MNPVKVLILAFVAIAGILLVAASRPARADDAPCRLDVAAAVAAAEKTGGGLIDLVDIPGDGADQLLIAEANGLVQVWPVKDGCMVLGGTPIVIARPRLPSTPA